MLSACTPPQAFLDPITAAKIDVYSDVPTAKLLELMPASSLPREYGGELPDAAYPLTQISSKATPDVDLS